MNALKSSEMANRQPKHIDTVLFDLDDTLLNSYDARVGALQTVFNRANITEFTAGEYLVSLKGAPFREALGEMVETRGLKIDLFAEYRRVYWYGKSGKIRLHRGVRPVLSKLRSRGYKLGIVSSKFRDCEFEGGRIGCKYELEAVNIKDMFATIIGLEDVVKPKPHPEGVNLALCQLGSKPQDTLFVGDSAADIESAQNAGCWRCWATWGVPDATGLPENLRVHFNIKSPSGLLVLDCLS